MHHHHFSIGPLDVPSALRKFQQRPLCENSSVEKKFTYHQSYQTNANRYILKCCRAVPSSMLNTVRPTATSIHQKSQGKVLSASQNFKLLLKSGKITQNFQFQDILFALPRHNKFSFLSLLIRTAGKEIMLPDKSIEHMTLVSPN